MAYLAFSLVMGRITDLCGMELKPWLLLVLFSTLFVAVNGVTTTANIQCYACANPKGLQSTTCNGNTCSGKFCYTILENFADGTKKPTKKGCQDVESTPSGTCRTHNNVTLPGNPPKTEKFCVCNTRLCNSARPASLSSYSVVTFTTLLTFMWCLSL